MSATQIAMLAGSTLLSAAGSIIGGQQQQAMYGFQAAQMKQQAAEERDAAKAEAEKIRRAKDRAQGEARAALAGSGVSVSEGSPIVIAQDIANRYEEDAFTALLNGDRRARSMNQQGAMYKMAGSNAMNAGYMGAGTSLLSGAMKYSGWK